MKSKILVVDDDPQGLESARKILEIEGHDVVVAHNGSDALETVRAQAFDVIVSDVRMPRLGGIEFFKAFSVIGSDTPVILMTAFGRIEDAVWAMKLGAVDFLTKPFKRVTLISAVENALARKRSHDALSYPDRAPTALRAASDRPEAEMIGQSEAMTELRVLIHRVASTRATVLIQGESGSGKERVARLLHDQSPRSKGPFVAINCAALPENLMEAELFGYERGAFTGAHQAHVGLFEAANSGTLFLDEIGDMPLSLQAKLLRVLQENEVRRVGATTSRKVDFRLCAATHRNLKKEVEAGTFREDLLFRLEVVPIAVPPLRDRRSDIGLLARHFLQQYCERHNKSIQGFTADAIAVLHAHTWPGNVRELSNVVERAMVLCSETQIDVSDLPEHLVKLVALSAPQASRDGTISVKLGTTLKDVEELMIRKTLEATDGDKNTAARLLGINSRTIYRKLEEQKK